MDNETYIELKCKHCPESDRFEESIFAHDVLNERGQIVSTETGDQLEYPRVIRCQKCNEEVEVKE